MKLLQIFIYSTICQTGLSIGRQEKSTNPHKVKKRERFYCLISQGFVNENLPVHRKRAVYKMLQKHFAGATSVAVRKLSIRRHVATWRSPRKKVRTWRFCLSWCRTGSNKQISSLSVTVAKRVSKYLIHCSFGMYLTD